MALSPWVDDAGDDRRASWKLQTVADGRWPLDNWITLTANTPQIELPSKQARLPGRTARKRLPLGPPPSLAKRKVLYEQWG